MTTESDIPEHLREGSTFGSRDDGADPYKEQTDPEQNDDVQDDETSEPLENLVASFEAVTHNSRTPPIGCRDKTFAAYLEFLKHNPDRMEEVGEDLAEYIGEKTDFNPPDVPDDKSGILRMLVWIGAAEAISDECDLIIEARAEYHRRTP